MWTRFMVYLRCNWDDALISIMAFLTWCLLVGVVFYQIALWNLDRPTVAVVAQAICIILLWGHHRADVLGKSEKLMFLLIVSTWCPGVVMVYYYVDCYGLWGGAIEAAKNGACMVIPVLIINYLQNRRLK